MIHSRLKDIKIVLASASPRRKLLFEMLGLKPLVLPAHVAEPISGERPYRQAMKHAKNKAEAILPLVDYQSLVVAADTIVVLDNVILGKPANKDEAAEFLSLLSGKTHAVYTGICLAHQGEMCLAYERSKVEFCTLTDAEIRDYINTTEPMDKAGAYGIQGYGAQFIKRISGCYFNVMGFPINLFYRSLIEINL